MAVYRRLTGMWVRGDRPGPTQRAMRTWVVLYAVVLAEFLFGVRRAMLVAGVVLGVAIVVVSRWTRIYVAELRGEA